MRASYLWAILITLAIGGWLASGQVIISGQGDTEAVAATSPEATDTSQAEPAVVEDTPFKVRVRTISAIDREAELKIRGRTEAEQRVNLRAQTPGLVEEIDVEKGDKVAAGDVVCKLEAGSRQAHILRARASLAQAELDHDALSKLSEKGYAAQTRVRSAKAALDAARAELHEAELDLDRTTLRAPFDGIIDTLPAEIGTLLSVGDVCAEIVAGDPMLVVAQVSERDVGKLQTGMSGKARLVTGDTVEGTLSFIAPSADQETRTFRIELAVPNADDRLRDGVTAEITIPLQTTRAHRFSPAILTLNDSGAIGVRVVEAGNTVAWNEVQILGNEDGAVWVAGLPETVTIITVGQEYVEAGETVAPVVETGGAAPTPAIDAADSDAAGVPTQ